MPLHLQEDVGKELEKLIRTGHLEKINDVDEDCFVSPVVITVKSDKSVKIALDSRKLNDSCIKMRPHMPNMEELLNQISVEITRDRMDDIIVVTRGNKQDHEKKLFNVLNKLEKAGYRASKKKSEFFMNETKWLGHEINENGIKPNEEKVEAIIKLRAPENTKDLKSFLGAIQLMAKFLPKLSEQTDRLRKLLKKNEPLNWGPEQETDFNWIKQMLTEGPCLAHHAKDKDNMVTTDASKTGLGITLWQKQDDGNIKPIAYGSRYLNDTEKNYSIGELELLAVVWGLENSDFTFTERKYIYIQTTKHWNH